MKEIAFEQLQVEFRPAEYYKTGKDLMAIALNGSQKVKAIRDSFDQIEWGI